MISTERLKGHGVSLHGKGGVGGHTDWKEGDVQIRGTMSWKQQVDSPGWSGQLWGGGGVWRGPGARTDLQIREISTWV